MSDWKPWYEKMAEIDSAQEREDYLRGVFAPAPMQPSQVAGMAVTAGLANWGVANLLAAFRGRKRRKQQQQQGFQSLQPGWYEMNGIPQYWDGELWWWQNP